MTTTVLHGARISVPFTQVSTAVQDHFDRQVGPLFTTDADDLFDVYLSAFPEGERQHHNCNCCRQFIMRYGHLVTINTDGTTRSAIWNPDYVPLEFRAVFEALDRAARRANVNGVFITEDKRWGTPITGEWHHFFMMPPRGIIHRSRVETAYQVMAKKKQDFGTLSHGLADFPLSMITLAVNMLSSNSLFRGEKIEGPLRFLANLHNDLNDAPKTRRKNLIWRAVAMAQVGFCTPRSSMVGTLLDDLKAGYSVEDAGKRFAAKMNPLQYQRPQAPARAGNIEQAEKLVEKMGIQNSLMRRFARFDEIKPVDLLWGPINAHAKVDKGGVFGHLIKNGTEKAEVPVKAGQPITFDKFRRKVMPEATSIQVKLNVGELMPFCGMVTAVDFDAPPILQWDMEDARNPFSWFLYSNGSTAAEWGLVSGWVTVKGITLKPSMWGDDEGDHAHQGNGAIFILDGARDVRNRASLCLFPEILKKELHAIRSTIESFSQAGKLGGATEADANGLMFNGGDNSPFHVRVTGPLGITEYKIDRWD